MKTFNDPTVDCCGRDAADCDCVVHADYPHEPGRLDSCLACSIECFCTGEPGDSPCVYCGEAEESAKPSYGIHVRQRDVTGYDESGEWMDGDQREIRKVSDYVVEFDPEFDDGTPVEWAIAFIRKTDAGEASTHPIPAELGGHEWLYGTYEHPYKSEEMETTVRLVGDWSGAERSVVFKGAIA